MKFGAEAALLKQTNHRLELKFYQAAIITFFIGERNMSHKMD
jgi:hypothetical protein